MDYFCKTKDTTFVKKVLKLANSRKIEVLGSLFNSMGFCEGIHIGHHRIQIFCFNDVSKNYCERITKKELLSLIKQLPTKE